MIGAFLAVSALGVYTYWDEIRHFFSSDSVEIQSAQPQGDISDNLSLSPVPSDVVDITATPTSTPTPTVTALSFTLAPEIDTDEGGDDHPGLHLGQTKTPKPDNDDQKDSNEKTND